MRMDVFGDSYDFVKRSLLQWLGAFGDWSVHPMFTDSVSAADVAAYETLLGATVVSADVLGAGTDRRAYLACAAPCRNLFLDPDTGLRMEPTAGWDAVKYVFARELVWLAGERPGFAHDALRPEPGLEGPQEVAVGDKLRLLSQDGLFGYACGAIRVSTAQR